MLLVLCQFNSFWLYVCAGVYMSTLAFIRSSYDIFFNAFAFVLCQMPDYMCMIVWHNPVRTFLALFQCVFDCSTFSFVRSFHLPFY